MNKIGVFGGSFDPVHKGHIKLAKAALSELQLDKLIVMPARVQPFKLDAVPASPQDRVAMLNLAFDSEPLIEVSTHEIDSPDISYTYNTLSYIRENFDDSKIYFIMGADSLLTLEKWYRGEDLLKEFCFAVSARPGYDDSQIDYKINYYREKYGADITKLLSTMIDVSATQIRNTISDELHFEELLDKKVFSYIKGHNLYVRENL